jgi:hypothetical protein
VEGRGPFGILRGRGELKTAGSENLERLADAVSERGIFHEGSAPRNGEWGRFPPFSNGNHQGGDVLLGLSLDFGAQGIRGRPF